MKVSAIVPVRAGSRRLANKNIRPFGDTNLFVHKLRQLRQVKGLDQILVSSDSEEMLDMARQESRLAGIPIDTHQRAPEYCDEQTKTFNEVVEHIVSQAKGDVIMWAPCVCPLCGSDRLEQALKDYVVQVQHGPFDSVISAKPFKEYLFGTQGPMNWDPAHHVPSQFLPDWKVIVNGFYIASKENMLSWSFVYGPNPYLYLLSKAEAVDIDDEADYLLAKVLFERK